MLRGILRNVQYYLLFFSTLLVLLAFQRLRWFDQVFPHPYYLDRPFHHSWRGTNSRSDGSYTGSSPDDAGGRIFYGGDESREIGLFRFRLGLFKFVLPMFSSPASWERTSELSSLITVPPPPNKMKRRSASNNLRAKLERQIEKLSARADEEQDQGTDGQETTNSSVTDLFPDPEFKGGEKVWAAKMKTQKKELVAAVADEEWKKMMQQHNISLEDKHAGHALQVSEEIKAIRPPKGTERWPSPSEKAGVNATILLKPAFGSHRPSSDAILVFAEGYDLSIYLAFVESLASTGYDGDVVLSISEEDKLKPGVKEYLQSKTAETGGVNIVAYEGKWTCFKRSGEVASLNLEGIHSCKMNNAFGDASGNPISDPRDPRPVATARYELFWAWSFQYNKDSWLMLTDARDVWFQSNPFAELTARGKVPVELHFFEENAEAVTIGTSIHVRRLSIEAYGKKAVEPFFDKPVICSGSTIGNQDAIETYLRAMVAEYDATLCQSKGCDQAFHNYLYYSGKLGRVDSEGAVEGLSNVVVHQQGKGTINNLGALRTKPLKEWGMYDAEREVVVNWDGTMSPVAHQYDRDKEVNALVKRKKRQFEQKWKANKR